MVDNGKNCHRHGYYGRAMQEALKRAYSALEVLTFDEEYEPQVDVRLMMIEIGSVIALLDRGNPINATDKLRALIENAGQLLIEHGLMFLASELRAAVAR